MFTPAAPTQIVILGGTGDLSKRKLIPALLDLYVKEKLPNSFQVVGLARSEYTDADYQQFVTDSIAEHAHNHSEKQITDFCAHISYVAGSFTEKETYTQLEVTLEKYQKEIGQCTNRLYYLAVPPAHYETIFEQLHELTKDQLCGPESGWTRILVEKPFGKDYKSALALDQKLSSLFKEEQIYRIDHYLAKDAVQNLLSFRFANMLTKSGWDTEHISDITIEMKETVDVDHRANFYDGIGALRDVGQNHLLQLLALVTMDEPIAFTAEAIRTKRAEILEALCPTEEHTPSKTLVRAQYEGYTNISEETKNSVTETYFALTTTLSTPRWKNTPITIKAGKALDTASVRMTITYHDVATGPFETSSCTTTQNSITLTLAPEQTVSVTLNSKAPGLGYNLESRTLSLDCKADTHEEAAAYEKVLLDCIHGDQTLFTTTREVLAAWKFITGITDRWYQSPLHQYKKGSEGPELSQ